MPDGELLCPSCSSAIQPDWTECPICGFDLTQLAPLPPEPPPAVPAAEPVPPPAALSQATPVPPVEVAPGPALETPGQPPLPARPPLTPVTRPAPAAASAGKPKGKGKQRQPSKSGKTPASAPAVSAYSLFEHVQKMLAKANQLEQANDLQAALDTYREALSYAEANRKADFSLELAVQTLAPLVRRIEQTLAQSPAPVPPPVEEQVVLPGKVPVISPGKASAHPLFPGLLPQASPVCSNRAQNYLTCWSSAPAACRRSSPSQKDSSARLLPFHR